MKDEKQTRKEIIDNRLIQAGWNVTDRTQVFEEFFISVDNNGILSPIEIEEVISVIKKVAA